MSIHEATLADAGKNRLADCIENAKRQLHTEGLTRSAIARAFAVIREVADRELGMRHFDVQLIGGWIMMEGMLAEMGTGEGKTLSATLPACTAAMTRIPVHVVSVNDYLVTRDAEEMAPVDTALGLTVGSGLRGTGLTPGERYCAGQGRVQAPRPPAPP